jgi:DNA-binding phage protein
VNACKGYLRTSLRSKRENRRTCRARRETRMIKSQIILSEADRISHHINSTLTVIMRRNQMREVGEARGLTVEVVEKALKEMSHQR